MKLRHRRHGRGAVRRVERPPQGRRVVQAGDHGVVQGPGHGPQRRHVMAAARDQNGDGAASRKPGQFHAGGAGASGERGDGRIHRCHDLGSVPVG